MTPEFDVVGRTDGLQLRLKRIAGRYTQELTVPGAMGPLVSGGGRDIFAIVDGLGYSLAFDQVGVDTRPSGSFRLRAQLDRPEFRIETSFKLAPERGVVDVITVFEAKRTLRLSGIENFYRFEPASGALSESEFPDYAWLPNLKYEADRVAGQHTFRSACTMIQHRDELGAIIPDTDEFQVCHGLPAALDYQAPDVMRYGLAAHGPEGIQFCRRQPGGGRDLVVGETVSYRFSLMVRRGLLPRRGHSEVVRFLWRRRGRTVAIETVQAVPFDGLAQNGYNALRRDKLWRDIRIGTRDVGGVAGPAWLRRFACGDRPPGPVPGDSLFKRALSQIPLLRKGPPWIRALLDGKESPVLFKAGANNARTAVGLAIYGQRWEDSWLQGAAGKIMDLVLSSPHPAGLLPEMFIGSERRPDWAPGWSGRADEMFLLENMAETAFWMLQYEKLCGRDGLLARCAGLAELLVGLQRESGGFAQNARLEPSGRVTAQGRETAGASASAGRFLAAIYQRLEKPEFLAAAERSADWLLSEEFPKRHWWDSDIPVPGGPPIGPDRDPVTGLFPQGTMSIYWASDLLRRLTVLNGDDRYRQLGRAILDDLLLYQQLWNAPVINAGTRGGFGAHNMGAECSDARGALFAMLLLDWYDCTGEAEYFERAVAALRAGFAVMHIPENANSPSDHTKGPINEQFGALRENRGNSARDGGVGRQTPFDWGHGTAGTAAGLATDRYGDAYIDVPRKQAFGINACTIAGVQFQEKRVDLTINRDMSVDSARHSGLKLKFRIDAETSCAIAVNGRELGCYAGRALVEGIIWNPDDGGDSMPEQSAERVEGVTNIIVPATGLEEPPQDPAGEVEQEVTHPSQKEPIWDEVASPAEPTKPEEPELRQETGDVSIAPENDPRLELSGQDPETHIVAETEPPDGADVAPKPGQRRTRSSRRKNADESGDSKPPCIPDDCGDEEDAGRVVQPSRFVRIRIATSEGLLGNDNDE